MKITPHLKNQIEHAQGASIDLETLTLTGEESNLYLVNEDGDPVPPGTPPPVPPSAEIGG